VNQKSCVALVAHGITSESLVAFVKNGVIVPEPMTDILRDMIEVLKVIASDLEVIEQRIWKLENER
jgi:sulfur carrier protein ThiS